MIAIEPTLHNMIDYPDSVGSIAIILDRIIDHVV
jgi:hypothetical protein